MADEGDANLIGRERRQAQRCRRDRRRIRGDKAGTELFLHLRLGRRDGRLRHAGGCEDNAAITASANADSVTAMRERCYGGETEHEDGIPDWFEMPPL